MCMYFSIQNLCLLVFFLDGLIEVEIYLHIIIIDPQSLSNRSAVINLVDFKHFNLPLDNMKLAMDQKHE